MVGCPASSNPRSTVGKFIFFKQLILIQEPYCEFKSIFACFLLLLENCRKSTFCFKSLCTEATVSNLRKIFTLVGVYYCRGQANKEHFYDLAKVRIINLGLLILN